MESNIVYICVSPLLVYISAYIFLGAAARSNVLSFNYLANNGPSGFPVGNLSDPYLAGRRHPTCSELIYNMCGGRPISHYPRSQNWTLLRTFYQLIVWLCTKFSFDFNKVRYNFNNCFIADKQSDLFSDPASWLALFLKKLDIRRTATISGNAVICQQTNCVCCRIGRALEETSWIIIFFKGSREKVYVVYLFTWPILILKSLFYGTQIWPQCRHCLWLN